MKSPQEGVGEGLVLHLLDVGAGGEGLFRAGEHDRADGGIGLEASSAALRSSISAALSALSACGRLSRIRPTRPWVSTMMFW